MGAASNWSIAIVARPEAEDFEVTLRMRSQVHTFYCKLPPDLSELLAAAAVEAEGAQRGMAWRRAPGEIPAGQVYFNAGNRATLRAIGGRLFNALFNEPGGHADVLMNEVAHAREDGGYVNITIDLSRAPGLVEVPWEALYFDAEGRFLATDVATNFVRVLPSRFSMPLPPPVEGPMRVLLVIANPFGDLDVERERAQIVEVLSSITVAPAGSSPAPAFEVLEPLVNATRAMLREALPTLKPHIIHYIGHGAFAEEQGLIALQAKGRPGEADLIDTDALRQLIQNDPPWLAFLNSCQGAQAARANPFGGSAQGLIQLHVPFVLAMQFPISDKAAILFASDFYAALASGLPVVQAVSRGRSAIATEDDCATELITPVLYTTGAVDTIAVAPPMPPPATAAASPPPLHTPTPQAVPPARSRWIVPAAIAAVALLGTLGFAFLGGSDNAVQETAAPPPKNAAAPASEPQARRFETAAPTFDAAAPPVEDAAPDDAPAAPVSSTPPAPRMARTARATAAPPAPPPPQPLPTIARAALPRPPVIAHSRVPPPPAPAPSPEPVIIAPPSRSSADPVGSGFPPPLPPPPIASPTPRPVIIAPATRGFDVRRRSSARPGGPGTAAPPALPLPPTPPPAAPMVRCNSGPFIVFFDWNRAMVTAEAASILASALAAYADCPQYRVTIAGYSDSSGQARYNLRLAERRNASVRSYLASRGIPDAAVTVRAFGESQLRVPTADGVRELQNRRVEITFEPERPSSASDQQGLVIGQDDGDDHSGPVRVAPQSGTPDQETVPQAVGAASDRSDE